MNDWRQSACELVREFLCLWTSTLYIWNDSCQSSVQFHDTVSTVSPCSAGPRRSVGTLPVPAGAQPQFTSSQPDHQVLGRTVTWPCNEVTVFIRRVLLEKLPDPQLRFVEPDSSLPYSQQPLLSQINSLNTPPRCFLQIHCNVPVSYRYSVMSPYFTDTL